MAAALNRGFKGSINVLNNPSGSEVGSLSLTLPRFYEGFLLTPAFSPENEEISAPPPSGLLIGICKFCESWSTETFRKEDSKRWAASTGTKPQREVISGLTILA